MKKVLLMPHDIKYAKSISSLSSQPQVREPLGLSEDQTSVEGTIQFIEFMQEQEKLGTQYSRVIFNENNELIGIITLKDIDKTKKTCEIGTWIGYPYWGKGYNELAKKEILYTAFAEMDLEYVFVAVKKTNIRSQKAQAKLPYIRMNVQHEFPEKYKKVQEQLKVPCLLNVIERNTFLKWYSEQKQIS